MKKPLCLLLAAFMMFALFAACSTLSSPSPTAATPAPTVPAAATPSPAATPAPTPASAAPSGKITVTTNMTGDVNTAVEDVVAAFTKETGIQVDYSAPANDYESLMKAKMATGDMPDVFSTHGWAVARYGDFLLPLNDQAWAGNVDPFIKPMITDKNGNLLVLPEDMDIAGIVYNKTVLNASGVDAASIKTWADFEAACGKIKAAGYTPVFMGAKDTWTIGQFFDWVAPSFFITNEASNDRAALLDGSFDWNKWGDLLTMFKRFQDEGYYNKDVLTADYAACGTELGNDHVGFEFFGNYIIADAVSANPNVQLGLIPVPANDPSDTPTLIAGEHLAVGVWKDSPNKDAALAFINYLARPDVMTKLASVSGMPAGITGVPSDTGMIAGDLQTYSSTRTFPYFDRVYLPSGMWDDMCTAGINVLKGDPIADQVTLMKDSYTAKIGGQ
ncbi:MAG: extracellular solute-binding protein [Firmicutes bacterium]|nr:extracellular solute-binding protein [Bacillota bacterium]